jgi:hypothetical protein
MATKYTVQQLPAAERLWSFASAVISENGFYKEHIPIYIGLNFVWL